MAWVGKEYGYSGSVTLPNWITLFRFLMVPLFVGAMLYYGESGENGAKPVEWYRWLAVTFFVIAAVSDALDGWIARIWKLQSRLGALLDPIADKLLVISAVVTLSFIRVEGLERFPLWYPVLILSRDAILLAGTSALYFMAVKVEIKPHWTGKVGTALQMVLVSIVLLKINWLPFDALVVVSGICLAISQILYMRRGFAMAHEHKLGRPDVQ